MNRPYIIRARLKNKVIIMQNNLSENLNMLMSQARISSDELARQVGIPATTIKRIRNSEHANPTIYTLIPIANYFSVSLNELINSSMLMNKTANFLKMKKIPLFSWEESIQFRDIEYTKRQKNILIEGNGSEKTFALIVEDETLEFFPKGCILIVDPIDQPLNGDYIVITNIENNIFSIRKYIIDMDQIYLKPLISGAKISILTPEYKILGVILQSKMELKK